LEGPHDAEAMERSALKRERTLYGGIGRKNQRRGLVKSNAEELGSGVECKGGTSQRELGLMRGLMGVRTEETTFTFSGVDWKAPFQRPFFKVIEGFLDRVGSFQRVR